MTPVDFSRLVFALLFASFAAAAGGNLKILNVHPSGEDVPASRQIVVRFDRPVVAIGRMDRKKEEIPITVSPALNCQWRWLDRTSLACQLGDKAAMQKATRYTVTVWPGIETRERETTAQPYVHEFVTERPQVHHVGFRTWRSPGWPVLRVTFNQAVGRDSVERHVYLEAPSKNDAAERIAVKAEADPDDYLPPRFIVPPGENVLLDFGAQQGKKADDEAVVRSGVEARRVWLLTPQVELPLDSSVALKTEPGLVSAFGKERGARQKTELVFDTFPEFSFNGVACYGNDGSKLLITAANFESAGKCNPLKSVALNFSSPVLSSEIRDKTEITPDLAGGRKDYDPWANRRDYSSLGFPHKKGRSYNVYLPETLKAAEQYGVFMKEGETVNDEFGRAPTAAPDMLFWTDHRKPDFVRAYRNSVLEGRIASEAPLYVTNLEKVLLNYKTLTPGGAEAGKSYELDVPGAGDISFAMPMEIRRMLEGSSGAVYGSIDSIPPVAKGAGERVFFSQVTPYQLHVKLGHFNTLVWVTDLASGEPVGDAKVSIYKDAVALLSSGKAVLSAGTTGPGGTVVLDGVEKLDPLLETFGWRCSRDDCERLFVKVEKHGQLALIPLNHDFEVDAYRASGYTVYARQQKEFGHIRSWGTTAQGVYRPGDTMQYKLYVRNQDNTAFVPPPRHGYRLEIIDPSGKTVHRVEKVELNQFGGFHGDYRIPETAMAGWHRFRLTAGFTKYDWQPMKVLVSDFTPSPFKVDSELNGDLFHPGDTLEIQTQARLHSGGAYTDAQARVTVELKAGHFRSEHPLAAGFLFSSSAGASERQLLQKTVPLGDKGESRLTLTLPDADIVYGRLRVESGVQDDRGKTVAALSSADYLGVDRLVGLKNTRWLYREDEEAEIRYLVVDPEGVPAAGTKVDIRIRREETVAAKVKGAGNAYVTQFNTAWVDAGACRGVSAKEPLTCSFTPDRPGTYKVSAEIGDARGKRHISELTLWVAGKGRVIWRQPDDNSLQILPEKTEYSVGATARYLIKNPYPGAYALMTLERYGVIRQWVEKLEGSTPVVEFPVDRDLLPGFYFSAVVVSPRVEAPPPEEGQVDLGKPAFKIGYLEVPVRDPWKKIEVRVTTDAEVYKPRGKVRAKLKARVENPEASEPVELAVAVLDEAVLDLVAGGRDHFDPYLGFYRLEGLDLKNYSLLTRLLGRQKFEKKGANSGGDGGGALSMRSLFKYVSYWNPSIIADSNGRAEIEFDLPDNLTGWRILALAVTPGDRMGLGDRSFKVNRPTEVRPVMPNQVTEGDRFKAGFSVMNRTDEKRVIDVAVKADGNLEIPVAHSETLPLGPYKRKTVYVDVLSSSVERSRLSDKGEIRFSVRAHDRVDGDGLSHHLPVLKRRSLETAANYGSTVMDVVREDVEIPEGIHTDIGEISMELAPSVIGNLAGAFRYMRDYPFTCWEQKLSKGVTASHYRNLKNFLPDDFEWPESAELVEEMLRQAADYQAPNGGMVYFVPEDEYVSPFLSAYTALAFNWLRDAGRTVPQPVEDKLHGYLRRLLRKDVFPDFYGKGMASTVRAVALAALSRRGGIGPPELHRYLPHAPYMSLFGKAHFLMAAQAVNGGGKIARKIRTMIDGHAQQSGGKFSFNEELDDGYARLLATPLRDNCAILSAAVKGDGGDADEMPFKLVRTVTQTRGNRDHWENTQENLFCLNALIDYSRRFESAKPAMKVAVDVGRERIGAVEFRDLRDKPEVLVRPLRGGDAGSLRTVVLHRLGEGRLYHATRLSYAPLEEQSGEVDAGIDIRREYSVERQGKWVLLDGPDKFANRTVAVKRGELVRVDLFASLPTARNFVVVEDPVPGGLEPVNRDLATASAVDAEKGDMLMAGGSWWFRFADWISYNASRWSFYHREIKHDAVRFYSDYLPAGRYHLSYTAQAIAPGEFARRPARAEEMYDPDVYGRTASGKLIVETD